MRAILLAIGGAEFREESVRLSVELSWRLKAKLNVLQIVTPGAVEGWKGLIRRFRNSLRTFENNMAAVAFAEFGLPENALKLLDRCYEPEFEGKVSSGKKYDLFLAVGNPEDEMVRYLDDHREVVLTVFDSPDVRPERLQNRIDVPFVMVQPKAGTSRPNSSKG